MGICEHKIPESPDYYNLPNHPFARIETKKNKKIKNSEYIIEIAGNIRNCKFSKQFKFFSSNYT